MRVIRNERRVSYFVRDRGGLLLVKTIAGIVTEFYKHMVEVGKVELVKVSVPRDQYPEHPFEVGLGSCRDMRNPNTVALSIRRFPWTVYPFSCLPHGQERGHTFNLCELLYT